MTISYPKNIKGLEFPSSIHRMAYIQYGGRDANDKTLPYVNNILLYLKDSQVGILKKIYLEETRFTRYQKIKEYWNENILVGKEDEEDKKILDIEVKVLLYLLEMLCLEDCQQKRKNS